MNSTLRNSVDHCRLSLALILFSFFFFANFAQSNPDTATTSENLKSFQNIVIDLRGSRGGRGDIAAGYLTALDMIKRHGYDRPITFIVEAADASNLPGAGSRILGKLLGKDPVKNGDKLYGGKIQVYEAGKIPSNFSPADLYLSLSNSSGKFNFEKDFEIHSPGHSALFHGGIPIDEKTVLFAQTAMGNTENQQTDHPLAGARKAHMHGTIPSAGLARNELGIYEDVVATQLSNKSPEEVRQFLFSEIGHLKNKVVAGNLRALLGKDKPALQNSKLVVAYGITATETKPQFETYLEGLVKEAEQNKTSFTILTPSGFKLEDIQSEPLREKIRLFSAERAAALPGKAEPGIVQIVKTGSLPHRTFVGLMKLSEAPPIVAGDGAVSAAVSLGKPFVMTRVQWNAKNIENLSARLLESSHLSDNERSALVTIFPQAKDSLNLARALELGEKPVQTAFSEALKSFPKLTDNLVATAIEVRQWEADSGIQKADVFVSSCKLWFQKFVSPARR